MHIICALEVKGHKYQGHVGQGQRSNKDPRERQVGSQQRQVASLILVFSFAFSIQKEKTLRHCHNTSRTLSIPSAPRSTHDSLPSETRLRVRNSSTRCLRKGSSQRRCLNMWRRSWMQRKATGTRVNLRDYCQTVKISVSQKTWYSEFFHANQTNWAPRYPDLTKIFLDPSDIFKRSPYRDKDTMSRVSIWKN